MRKVGEKFEILVQQTLLRLVLGITMFNEENLLLLSITFWATEIVDGSIDIHLKNVCIKFILLNHFILFRSYLICILASLIKVPEAVALSF